MKAAATYPPSTVYGGDLIAGFFKERRPLKPGEKCINTMIDSEDLPITGGYICFHQDTVKKMAKLLGLKVLNPAEQRQHEEDQARIEQLEQQVAELDEQIERFKGAIMKELSA